MVLTESPIKFVSCKNLCTGSNRDRDCGSSTYTLDSPASDFGSYRFTKDDDYILLIVHVDDLLYIGSTDKVTTWFEGELQRDLTLTVSSTVTQYLGLNIQEEEGAIYLNAAKYADTIGKRVLTFDHEGRPILFDTWLDDLQLYLLSDSRDSVSLFDHTSGASLAPPTATGIARYSSPATAALGRLILPYLFPELSPYATVEDLVNHLRTSDTRYRPALPVEFLHRNPPPPPMYITLYFIVTRLPDSLHTVRDHSLALDSTDLTVDLLEKHLLAAETSVVAVGAARGTPRTTFFEGCSPSPLTPSYASAAVVDILGAEDVGAALRWKRRSSKGKGGKSGGGGSGGGGGGGSGGGGGGGGGGTGGSGGRSGAFGGGDGGSSGGGGGGGGGSGSGGGGNGGGRGGAVQQGGSGDSERQQQQCRSETPTPQQLREWFAQRGASGGSVRCVFVIRTGDRTGQTCGKFHTQHRCFSHLDDAWRAEFGDEAERFRWKELLRSGVDNLVSTAALQDAMVTTTTPGGQRVWICTCTRTGRHLATFTPRPGSSRYTLTAEPPQVAASAQVSATGPVAAPCSCFLLSHQTLLWHHFLGHPSLPRLRGMHSRLLVAGLSRSLSPLTPSPAPPCLSLHRGAADHERYFLLVVDDYTRYTTVFPLCSKGAVHDVVIPWIRAVRFEFFSDLLRKFCRGEGILQSFTLPASSQKNGVAERRIGLVMEVARDSMIHAAAPHFLWPFAVRYTAHQLNLWPRVSLPETSPTLRWTGKVGDASVFRVWGSRAFVRDTSVDKLSSGVFPCVFLDFPPNAPGWQFYHPTSRRFLPSQDVLLDESVPFYHLFPYHTAPLPPPPLFLALGPAPVDFLPPQGPAPSGVSQVDPLPLAVPVEVAGAEPGGAESEGAESGGAEPEGAEPGGTEPQGAEPGGAESEGAESGGAEPRGIAAHALGVALQELEALPLEALPLEALELVVVAALELETLALEAMELETLELEEGVGGAGAGGTGAGGAGVSSPGGAGADGPGGARTRGTEAAGAGGVGDTGAGDPVAGGTCARGVGAGGAGAGGTGAGGTGAGGAGTGGDGVGGPGAGDPGAEGAGGTSQPKLQPDSPLPAPSPYAEQTNSLTKRREPESRPASPFRAVRTGRRIPCPRPPPVPGTHIMALCPSSVRLRVPLPSPPTSSLPDGPDSESDLFRAASPTLTRLLATTVTDPSLESAAASALVAELVDFVAACRLDYAPSLIAESEYDCPPSIGGECALGTNVLEDRQEDLECLAAATPHLMAMLFALEGDPDALDIPTPRS
ncbi:unnamed protein product [Closterium sp. NIES-53]